MYKHVAYWKLEKKKKLFTIIFIYCSHPINKNEKKKQVNNKTTT